MSFENLDLLNIVVVVNLENFENESTAESACSAAGNVSEASDAARRRYWKTAGYVLLSVPSNSDWTLLHTVNRRNTIYSKWNFYTWRDAGALYAP